MPNELADTSTSDPTDEAERLLASPRDAAATARFAAVLLELHRRVDKFFYTDTDILRMYGTTTEQSQ